MPSPPSSDDPFADDFPQDPAFLATAASLVDQYHQPTPAGQSSSSTHTPSSATPALGRVDDSLPSIDSPRRSRIAARLNLRRVEVELDDGPGGDGQPAVANHDDSDGHLHQPNPSEPTVLVVQDMNDVDIELPSPVLPPPSLYSLFRQRKGYFSATDLSAPAWCFLQYDYGLRGSRNLPLALRPPSFVSARGREIKPDVQQAETNAKIMEAGTEVHKKLEREIHPVQIRVEVETNEERYGLRILNMVASVEALIHLGICREMPVMGFIQGHFVVGVIDEIQRTPIQHAPAPPEPPPPISAFPLPSPPSVVQSPPQPTSSNRPTRSPSKPALSKSTPSKSSTKSSSKSTKYSKVQVEGSIAQFFKPVSFEPIVLSDDDEEDGDEVLVVDEYSVPLSAADAAPPVHHPPLSPEATSDPFRSPFAREGAPSTARQPTHKLFISDSKTRRSFSLPREDAMLTGKLQCQVYKCLLDDLLSPTATFPLPSTSTPTPTMLDSRTKHVLAHVVRYLKLDLHRPFSASFVDLARELMEGNSITFPDSPIGEGGTMDLGVMIDLWERAVERLGVGSEEGTDRTLTLVYRYQSPMEKSNWRGRGKGKRKAGSKGGEGEEREVDDREAQEERDLQRVIQASLAVDTHPQEAQGLSSASFPYTDSYGHPPLPPSSQPGSTRAVEHDRDGEEAIDDGPLEVPEGALDGPSSELLPFVIDRPGDEADFVGPTVEEEEERLLQLALKASLADAPDEESRHLQVKNSLLEHSSSAPVDGLRHNAVAGPSTLSLSDRRFSTSEEQIPSPSPSDDLQQVENLLSPEPQLQPPSKREQMDELMANKLPDLRRMAGRMKLPTWGAKNILAGRIYNARKSAGSGEGQRAVPSSQPGPASATSSVQPSPPSKKSKSGTAIQEAATQASSTVPSTSSAPLIGSPNRPPSKIDEDIIGSVSFLASADLVNKLSSILDFWMGRTRPVGVPESQTWKCNSCEMRASCEWREEEASRIWEERKGQRRRGSISGGEI